MIRPRRSDSAMPHGLSWPAVGLVLVLVTACSSPAPVPPTTAPAATTAAAAKPAATAVAAAVATSAPAVAAAAATSAPAAATAVAAVGAVGAVVKPTGTPIKLGVLADISAAFANQGSMMRIMTEYAVQRINAEGGINGRPLQVLYADPKGDPNQAVQFASQFIQQDNVDVVIGAVSSAECLAVQDLVAKVQTVYVTSTGCASDELTSKFCNKYTFRTGPQGIQTSDPLAAYLVKNYGPNWSIIYQDYAFGQSYQRTMEASLQRAGGNLNVKIAMPLGEANVTPYVSRIPTDGSVTGFLPPTGGSDVSRVMSVFNQFGLGSKITVAGASVRENFGGVWPEVLNGEVFIQGHPSVAIPGNALSEAWVKGATAVAAQPDQKQFADIMGGIDKFGPGGQGYQAYTAITALKTAMVKSNYQGKGDTDKMIAAFETLDEQGSIDFPVGRFIMNKNDHQANAQQYIIKLNGQQEEVLQVVPAEEIPSIGSCKISG
jgi:branched-chain amino acid transport system substrate-binding protein